MSDLIDMLAADPRVTVDSHGSWLDAEDGRPRAEAS